MKRDPIINKGVCLLAALLLIAAGQAHAQQGQSMEERLRAQLRATTTQLQEAQNELAALKASGQGVRPAGAKAEAPAAEADELRKELAALKSQLASERSTRQQGVVAQQQALAKANEQAGQYRSAYDGLLKIARASENERQRLAGEEKQHQQAVAMCTEKNVKLYSVGQEILQAYENMDMGTIMSARQPFAAQSRVKYEQIAQEYGDKLYEGKFDLRAVAQPAPPAAASGAQQSQPAVQKQ
ncbi:hypothetical protein [Herbaspirillum robiniae]|uniref:hypothetical protein n=1 Tax=Herbaspirillum robiniae TaxID=2014887 RepID=UPI001A9C3D0B|nr:hypothetical protein [Herbaspirillum robiniae]